MILRMMGMATAKATAASRLFRILLLFSTAAAGFMSQGRANDAPDANKLALGKRVFTQIATPPCGACHTLQDAGTTGTIGAHLEEIQPDAQRVARAVRNGLGIMPPFSGKLTEEQIEAVALYVSIASRKQ
jgi:sulfite dehydrogenase